MAKKELKDQSESYEGYIKEIELNEREKRVWKKN